MDYRHEIDRLFELEYGEMGELLFRFSAIGAGGTVLFLYTGWIVGLLWVAGFYLLQLVYFLYLWSRGPSVSRPETFVAGSIFLVMLAEFLAVPAVLLVQDDAAMRISACAAIGSVLVFLIRRSDSPIWMLAGEIGVVAVCVAAILVMVWPQIDSTQARAITAICGLGLVVYFAQTVFIVRQTRLRAEAVAERTLQAQKLEAVGQLAGGIAHDFNNLLMALAGSLELYAEAANRAEKDKLIDDASAVAQRAFALVHQLLAYSRKSTLRARVQDICAIMASGVELGRHLLPGTVRIDRRLPPEPIRVRVDENQFVTALLNLIANARDALDGECGDIAISCQLCDHEAAAPLADGRQLPPGAYVRIAVADSGTGIPPDVLPRVLEPFYTTKPVGQGSGLGLSMVAGFARQSGGGLCIDTSEAGTTVSLYLPRVETVRGT